MTTTFTTVNRPLERIDGVSKVTGEQKYAVDISLPGMLHCKLLRSPVAHARIKRIDTGRAKAHPGVHSVWTAADLAGRGLNLDPNERVNTILALSEVLFCGQPIAAVLAQDPVLAEEAVSLIDLELEELPVVVDPLAAMEADAPAVRAPVGEVDRSEEQAHLTMATTAATEVRGGGN
ncbi:MAG: xanthine dehydrogenase family protein molybdopterin-binding subunit, partial [Chloroflexi bacterium]|nr:xanthine dehydrogenase family protein molybdopterin-binding subunit [Chloroflexota bacterium]